MHNIVQAATLCTMVQNGSHPIYSLLYMLSDVYRIKHEGAAELYKV